MIFDLQTPNMALGIILQNLQFRGPYSPPKNEVSPLLNVRAIQTQLPPTNPYPAVQSPPNIFEPYK